MGNNQITDGKFALLLAGLAVGVGLFLFTSPNILLDPIGFLMVFGFCSVAAIMYYPLGLASAVILKVLKFFAYQGTRKAWSEDEFFVRAAIWPVSLPFCAVWYSAVLVVNRLSDVHAEANEMSKNAHQWFYPETEEQDGAAKRRNQSPKLS